MRRDQPAGCVRRDKTPVVARYSRTTSARWCRNYQKGEKAFESIRTLVDGVVGMEVEDAVAGSGTKKTTARVGNRSPAK
ncbi:hypothetical protein B296_00023207 [Ensete ventricosum]|uniref:Uncharacterized protein n=1 Tax=Ensete ventricosum TaxID=4639 RepID=A0A426YW09_ENSVE|nr:hypothetical protein B296_00023207 [Ensete ventricosum]